MKRTLALAANFAAMAVLVQLTPIGLPFAVGLVVLGAYIAAAMTPEGARSSGASHSAGPRSGALAASPALLAAPQQRPGVPDRFPVVS